MADGLGMHGDQIKHLLKKQHSADRRRGGEQDQETLERKSFV